MGHEVARGTTTAAAAARFVVRPDAVPRGVAEYRLGHRSHDTRFSRRRDDVMLRPCSESSTTRCPNDERAKLVLKLFRTLRYDLTR